MIVRRSSQHAACTASVCSTAFGRSRADDCGDLGEIGDRADLVVDGHHADHRDVVERAPASASRSTRPAASTPTTGRRARSTACSTAWCSTAGHTAPPAAAIERAEDRGVVGLGAAAGEHDLAGPAAEHVGDVVARLVDRLARLAGEAVRTRWGWRTAR